MIDGKGGVGKTVTASLYTQWLGCNGIVHTALDCDDNNSFTKIHPESGCHVLRSMGDIEALMAKILDNELTVADCPAGITAQLASVFSTVEYKQALDSIQAKLVIFVPFVANDAASLDEVRRLVSIVKSTATYVIVKNERDGENFTSFDASATAQFLNKLCTPEIRIPKLDGDLRQMLNADRLSVAQFIGRYWAMYESDKSAAFRQCPTAQKAINNLKFIFEQFDRIAPTILPTAALAKIRGITSEAIREFCCDAWAKKQSSIKQERIKL